MNTQRCSTFNMPFVHLSALVNGNSCEIIELDGHPDEIVLREALTAAMARHPLLGSRLRRTWRGAQWIRDRAEAPPDVRVARVDSEDPHVLRQRLVANIWDEPLDLWTTRPARFHLTRTPRGSVLQLVTHHVASDARAGYRFAYDIAEAYTALAAGREPERGAFEMPGVAIEHRALSTQPASGAALTWRALQLLARDLVPGARSLELSARRGPTDVRKLDLNPNLLPGIKAAARARGCTVHALLLAATVRACQAHDLEQGRSDRRAYPLLDMVSMRPYAGPEAADVYDTCVAPVGSRFDGTLDDESLIASAAAQIQRLKSVDSFAELYRQRLYTWAAVPVPSRLAARLVTELVVKGNVICSNPGPVPYPIERFGPLSVTDFWSFSQLFPPGRITCTFSTFSQRLRLVLAYDRSAFPGDAATRFARPLIEALSGFVATAPRGQPSPAAAATTPIGDSVHA